MSEYRGLYVPQLLAERHPSDYIKINEEGSPTGKSGPKGVQNGYPKRTKFWIKGARRVAVRLQGMLEVYGKFLSSAVRRCDLWNGSVASVRQFRELKSTL